MAHILVIDDDETIRFLLRMVLEKAGHQVQEANDGKAGLRLLQRQPADLVFCDLFMPGQDGLETIPLIRRDHPAVKVVAMSGGGFNGRLDLLGVAVKFGAVAALDKPFGPDAILAVAASALGTPPVA